MDFDEEDGIFENEGDNIIVCVRLRAIGQSERLCVSVPSPNLVTLNSHSKTTSFAFDLVAPEDTTQVNSFHKTSFNHFLKRKQCF